MTQDELDTRGKLIEVLVKMDEQVTNTSPDEAHVHADDLLVQLINILQHNAGENKEIVDEIVEAYDKVGKYY